MWTEFFFKFSNIQETQIEAKWIYCHEKINYYVWVLDWELIDFPKENCFLLCFAISRFRQCKMPACDWNRTVECSGRLTRSFSWPFAALIGPLRTENVCRNIEYQASESRPSFWASHSSLIKDSIAAFLEAPGLAVNYSELRGRLGRYNHVCWCETPAWCGQHWSVRSKSP